jgi:Amt family ammonium transporter
MLGRRHAIARGGLVPHNVPFTLLGAGLLWFGWFGFNAGSALSASALAVTALVNTHAAAAAALACWLFLDLMRSRRTTAVGAATGAIVGLVAITPAAGFVTPRAALVIGALAAATVYVAMQLRARTKIDDALDVFACHGVAGILGALLTGVFATKAVNPAGADGLLAGNAAQLGVQALAVAATMALSGAFTAGIIVTLRALMPIRASLGDELTGLDATEHGEEAYHTGDIGEIAGGGPLGGVILIHADEESEAETVAA